MPIPLVVTKDCEGQRITSRETKFSGMNGNREIFIFPVQLTTSRIDNLTRLVHTLAICVATHIYTMATTHYSNQQGSRSRQNHCQVHSPENIESLSASRRCPWVRTTLLSIVWSAASISESELLQATEKTVSCAAHPTK